MVTVTVFVEDGDSVTFPMETIKAAKDRILYSVHEYAGGIWIDELNIFIPGGKILKYEVVATEAAVAPSPDPDKFRANEERRADQRVNGVVANRMFAERGLVPPGEGRRSDEDQAALEESAAQHRNAEPEVLVDNSVEKAEPHDNKTNL